MGKRIFKLELRSEYDVVLGRQRTRQICQALGLDSLEQTRTSTAFSEMARNVLLKDGGGRTDFCLDTEHRPSPLFAIEIKINGHKKDPSFFSHSELGSLFISRKFLDTFNVAEDPGKSWTLKMAKNLPEKSFQLKERNLEKIIHGLIHQGPQGPFEEVQQQNQELLKTMEELREKQEELRKLNKELEDTNRGVMALYAELDVKTTVLQKANEVKTHFLSNMTHEFRTPLNSIIGLGQILLAQMDGPLGTEQQKQVKLMVKSAEDLSGLINDLLDITKANAGKLNVRSVEFTISDLFSGLRGTLRPLMEHNQSVKLIFEEEEGLPIMTNDEGKISQIMRNFISNAIKYTEVGHILVSARTGENGTVLLSVSDTGIGIGQRDLALIFEEFVQIDSPLQKRIKGTGLGLPLSKKLADLIGGKILVESRPKKGSTFTLALPRKFFPAGEFQIFPSHEDYPPSHLLPILVVEDNFESIVLYENYLKNSGFRMFPTRTLRDARRALKKIRPFVILLDILLEGESTWDFLVELKENHRTRDIPILVVTLVDNESKAMNLGATAFQLKPINRDWLLYKLESLKIHQNIPSIQS